LTRLERVGVALDDWAPALLDADTPAAEAMKARAD
jgi:hypothetical protein